MREAVQRTSPLPEAVRWRAERFFGRSLHGVRWAEDPAVARMGARALAIGDRVLFAPGCADFHSAEGVALLGHELAHVLQQRDNPQLAPRSAGLIVDDARLERAADEAGWGMASDWGLAPPRRAPRAEAFWNPAGAISTAWSPAAQLGLEGLLQANWFTDSIGWTARKVRDLAGYIWSHRKEVVVVGAIVFQAVTAPDLGTFASEAVAGLGVSMVTAHVVMRAVRMVDANVQVRSPVITWPLGMAVIGLQGAVQHFLPSMPIRALPGMAMNALALAPSKLLHPGQSLMDFAALLPGASEIAGTAWFSYSVSTIISHAFFDDFDFRTALSPRRSHRGGTEVSVLYVKFPAPDIGLFLRQPAYFLRGLVIPYKGIAGGHSDPSSTAGKRHDTHHWEDYGFGPWWVIAASENEDAIKFAERLVIRYAGAAKRIAGPHVGQSQQDFGIFAPAALGWTRPFVREFIVWHFKDGLKHIAWLFDPLARAGIALVRK